MMKQQETLNIECRNASELLSRISLQGDTFGASPAGSWVFRGVSSASFDLKPSAFRDETKLVRGNFTDRQWDDWTNKDQIQSEAQTLSSFVQAADGAGFPIPLDSPSLRDELIAPLKAWYSDRFERGELIWPPRVALPLIALAQHYGLATRCLDWTRSPNVAAYFAASDTLKKPSSEDWFAVWAFSLAADIVWKGLEGPLGMLPARVAIVVDAPYASNPNLRAQEGVFITVPVTKLRLNEKAERLDFSEQLRQVHTYTNLIPLIKFVAPRSIAPELLWHLAKERVTAARLFPGYFGAALSVLETKLHVRPA